MGQYLMGVFISMIVVLGIMVVIGFIDEVFLDGALATKIKKKLLEK